MDDITAVSPAKAETPVAGFTRVGNTHVIEPGRGLMWTHTLGEADFAGAQALIDKANADKLGGFDDWRLPTFEELVLLADRSRFDPAIDTAAFPDTEHDFYWSSTPYTPDSGYAWGVYFSSGHSLVLNHTYVHYVRAVRASQ